MGGNETGAGAFSCHRCGACCTGLKERGRGQTGFEAVGEIAYRLPGEGGLRVFAWEADPFPDEALAPSIVVADRSRGALVALVYELDAEDCPLYDHEEQACTIYEERPLVCQAFPLIVEPGSDGLEVAASSVCGARVELDELAGEGSTQARLAQAYPNAFAPALAAAGVVQELASLARFLETAGVIEPVRGLEREDLASFTSTVSIVDVVEEAGVLGQADLRERADASVERVRKRWQGSAVAP